MYRPRYDPVTGTFLGLYETLGYIMVRGDPQEYFLDYGYSKQNLKILHSHYKKRVPSKFSGTFFNRHRIQFKSRALQSIFSNVYFSLPSTTDRIEDINRHMESVNLSPIDISEKKEESRRKCFIWPFEAQFWVSRKGENCQGCGQNALKNHRYIECQFG